jgi:hypothetical protein
MKKPDTKTLTTQIITDNALGNSLFNDLPTQSSPARCKDCKHIKKCQFGGSFFFYCSITKSHRTQNGFKKVLCKTLACGMFEKKETIKHYEKT